MAGFPIVCPERLDAAGGIGVQVRPYVGSDWARLCEIHDAARLQELKAIGLLESYRTLAQTAEDEGLLEGDLLVAEQGGQVQGFIACSEGTLTWLYVDPRRQRRGIARALLRAAIDTWKGPLSLVVFVGNEGARALYLSEGFQDVGCADVKVPGYESFRASAYVLRRGGHPDQETTQVPLD